jgi:hypothetical protein
MIKAKKQKGFTLVELLIAALMASIVIVGLGVVIANTQSSYGTVYDKLHGDVITDAFVVRRLFDSVIRKSSTSTITIDEDNDSILALYYENDSSTYLDSYIRLYTSGLELMAEYGTVDTDGARTTTTTETVCENVASCTFRQSGTSVRMVLTLDDDQRTNTVISSAVLHN